MSRLLRNMTIRRKLTLITMTASTVAILIACAGFAVYDLLAARRAMIEQMRAHAGIVAADSTASLSFGDPKDATAILSSMRAEPQIQVAVLFTADGRILATYLRDPELRGLIPSSPIGDTARFGSDSLEVGAPVTMDQRQLGWVYVRCDLHALNARLRQYAWITLLVFGSAYCAAWLLIRRMQRVVAGPVLHLAETARSLSENQDYSLRATKVSDDEIGLLTDAFNHMVHQAQRHTHALEQLNEQLGQEKDRAEQASRTKTAFLANMSHEIRTPMTAILGYTDMLLDPKLSPGERLDHVHTIRRNTEHLLTVINDILDLSKVEAGKLEVERIACNPAQVVSEVASLMRVRATERGLNFSVLFVGLVPETIQTDPTRLRQVLINLVSNAIKFTERGLVQLVMKLPGPGSGGEQTLEFDVIDSGIGMTGEQVGRLFQPFVQADASTTRRFGGTGLGLSICKRLAQVLGGDITVTSTPGRGSCFTLTIQTGSLEGVPLLHLEPEAVLHAPSEKPAETDPQLRGRVLLAEDGVHNQKVITYYLQSAGADVTVAGNGRIACEKAMQASAAGTPFDVILMDMQMPELDGYGAASALRAGGYSGPIVALTAHAMAHDRAKCIQSGCSDYVPKPIDRGLLLRMLAKYLGGTCAAKQDQPGDVKSVLKLADDPELQPLVEGFVADLPAHVNRLCAFLKDNDLASLRGVAHQMKGTGGTFGFMQLTRAAALVEQSIDARQQLEQIKVAVEGLIHTIEGIQGYKPGAEQTPLRT